MKKIKKLAEKRRKKPHKIRKPEIMCPSCMSILILNSKGELECSGNRFSIWEKEFARFSEMDDEEKLEYLETIGEKNLFFNFYEKWLMKTPNEKITCDYSHTLFTVTNNLKCEILDPIKVLSEERKLKRKLTLKELKKIPKIILPDK